MVSRAKARRRSVDYPGVPRRAAFAAAAAVFVAVALLHAGNAFAATASVSGGVLTYAASPGETNLGGEGADRGSGRAAAASAVRGVGPVGRN
jgi:hypothetical protein